MCSPDVAVVGSVRCECFPAVFALERPLTGVLPDVCAENAGRSESLRHKYYYSLYYFTFYSNLPQNMHKDTNTQGYAILLVQNEYTNSPEGVTRPLKKGSHRTR